LPAKNSGINLVTTKNFASNDAGFLAPARAWNWHETGYILIGMQHWRI